MSKKRDPLIPVIQYFQTADLASAYQALTMVREIVRSRQPVREGKKPASPAKRKNNAAEAHEPPLPLN